MGLILLLTVMIVFIASLPLWAYTQQWGYGPSGVVGMMAILLVVLLILEIFPLL